MQSEVTAWIFGLILHAMRTTENLRCPHEEITLHEHGFRYGIKDMAHNRCLTAVYDVRNKREWYEDDAIKAGKALCENSFPNGRLHLDWFGTIVAKIPDIASQAPSLNFLIGGSVTERTMNGFQLTNGYGGNFEIDDKHQERIELIDRGTVDFPRCLSARYNPQSNALIYNPPFPCNQHDKWNWTAVVCENVGFRKCDTLDALKRCVYSLSHGKCCPVERFQRLHSHPMEDLLYPCDERDIVNCGKTCSDFGNIPLKNLTNVQNHTDGKCGYVTFAKLYLPKSIDGLDCSATLCCREEVQKFIGHCPCSKDSCENGGKCIDDSPHSWHCDCTTGFTGVDCSKRIADVVENAEELAKKEYKIFLWQIAAGVYSAIFGILLFGLLAYIWGYCQGTIKAAFKRDRFSKTNTTGVQCASPNYTNARILLDTTKESG